ncbi:MAG: hypothetical protein OXC92_06075 [Flavobacteriaceae bacterium]|nr:hypothetical protein [Flavobacteriaceae bacterium]
MSQPHYKYKDPLNLDFTYLKNVSIPNGILDGNDARWVRRDETVVISGIEIKAGFFYLGNTLKSLKRNTQDRALINPKFKVEPDDSYNILRDNSLSWKSYSRFTPKARYQMVSLKKTLYKKTTIRVFDTLLLWI